MDAKDQVKERIDIHAVISRYVTLRRTGRNWVGLCPFHEEKTGSFTVNQEKQLFKCFGCGVGGDVFEFIMKIEGLSFREALEQLAAEAGVKLEFSPEQSRQRSEKELITEANERAVRAFLASRKQGGLPDWARAFLEERFAPETLETFDIGYAPAEGKLLSGRYGDKAAAVKALRLAGLVRGQGNELYDYFRDRVMFPIRDARGKVIAFGGRAGPEGKPKYLNSPETPAFNKSSTLYGLDRASQAIREADQAVLVEGYTDVIACHSAGLTNVVATLGTAMTESHIRQLKRYTTNVVLAYDADSAGINAALRGARMFDQAGLAVSVATMPEGKDPDEALRELGLDRVTQALAEARSLTQFALERAFDAFPSNTEAGRKKLVAAIRSILADVVSPVLREDYLQWTASRWTERAPARMPQVLTALRREVQQELRERVRERRRTKPSERGQGSEAQSEEAVEELELLAPGVVKAEKELIGLVLASLSQARDIIEKAHQEFFTVDLHRRAFNALSKAIQALPAGQGDLPSVDDIARQADGDEQVKALVLELAVLAEPEPKPELVSELLAKLEREQLARAAAAARAEFNKTGAPEALARYQELQRRLTTGDQ